ncbi:1-aminocyclopropane-1-carboxylate synthase-like protein 1 [Tubulanus polymorphus]|uniref:1-aminocyclopropane-1-carboxylate synthase-like protein 1 n=1 Tax=Tubulanus polymorphus TaxID=672921 RepID=UPI003DA365A5
MSLSQRANDTYNLNNFLTKYYNLFLQNPYDHNTNKSGILNLGTAETNLCSDILSAKIKEKDVIQWTTECQFYFDYVGIKPFREALATFFTERFEACKKIDPNNLSVVTGSGALLEALAFLICDDGDYLLGATPMYGGVFTDIAAKCRNKIYPISLSSKLEPGETEPFQLSLTRVKRAYQEAIEKGICIKGILLLNPSNPLGTVMDKKSLMDVLNFAAEHKIHVISDEVYGLSIFDKNAKHCSVLSLADLPDPDRTHFVWSFSKDFGLSGLRCGILHSFNKVLNATMAMHLTYFIAVPRLLQDTLTKIISDKEWLDSVYFPTNLQRMKECYDYMRGKLESIGIPVLDSKGAFFLWVQFGKVFGDDCTFAQELEFFESLVNLDGGGVYIVPGRELKCIEPGWFRVIFTMDRTLLDVGFDRMEKVVNSFRCSNKDVELPELVEGAVSNSLLSQDAPASLEGLLSTLTTQIRDSNWLKDNTAERWQSENPELAREWQRATKDQKST